MTMARCRFVLDCDGHVTRGARIDVENCIPPTEVQQPLAALRWIR